MNRQILTLKHFIKHLNEIYAKYGDIHVGLDVYTNEHGEFWTIGKRQIKVIDGGTRLALAQLRLKQALPRRKQMAVERPSVDSIFADASSALEEFADRYDIIDHSFEGYTDIEVLKFMLDVVHSDMENLTRLKDDIEKIIEVRLNARS